MDFVYLFQYTILRFSTGFQVLQVSQGSRREQCHHYQLVVAKRRTRCNRCALRIREHAVLNALADCTYCMGSVKPIESVVSFAQLPSGSQSMCAAYAALCFSLSSLKLKAPSRGSADGKRSRIEFRRNSQMEPRNP